MYECVRDSCLSPEGLGSRLYSCLYFASTSYELRLNFVRTLRRTNFAWKHNICAYRTYLCPNSTQLAETHSGKSIAQTMRTEAIGKDIDAGFHNDGAHNGRKDFKIPQQHYVIHTHFRHKETITRGTTSKLVERPVLPASSSWTILSSFSTCNTTHTYIYLRTYVHVYVCMFCTYTLTALVADTHSTSLVWTCMLGKQQHLLSYHSQRWLIPSLAPKPSCFISPSLELQHAVYMCEVWLGSRVHTC